MALFDVVTACSVPNLFPNLFPVFRWELDVAVGKYASSIPGQACTVLPRANFLVEVAPELNRSARHRHGRGVGERLRAVSPNSI
jgi:hypothetical protein